MLSAATVVVCALELLGRSSAHFPVVEFIDKVPVGVSALAAGYILPDEQRIFLVTSTDAFLRARRSSCRDLDAIREIAGVLAHEEWHLRHGADEEGAYDAQLIALLTAGADDNTPLFHKVKQAKLAVLARSTNARQTEVLASRLPEPDAVGP